MPNSSRVKSDKKIVVIGGGTGIFPILTGLKKHFRNISAIVAMSDEGGSTGMLREDFGILPPGDIRRALLALSTADNKILSKLFTYRFEEGRLATQSFGNLMITALERITGSFDRAVEEAGKILAVKGAVIPVTLKDTHLVATLDDGTEIVGEHNIDVPKHDPRLRIVKVRLQPPAEANPKAIEAILEADIIVIGPGDVYTSIIPNLLVKGMARALAKTKAKIVYFVNLSTKRGETDGFKASDFVWTVENYAGKVIDYVLVNSKKPDSARRKAYAEKGAEWVKNDLGEGSGFKVVKGDLLRPRGFLRHDAEKSARLLAGLFGESGLRRWMPFAHF